MSKILCSRVRAFGCTIDIISEGREAHNLLERYVFPPLPREQVGPEKPDVVLRVVEAAELFHLSVNDVAVATSDDPKELVTTIINAIDQTVIQRIKKMYAVHAGAVLIGGRGLLLPGGTHAGKSTLVAELLRRGAKYFSDEYALIDSEGRVHSYPRPLLVRNGSPKQLPVLPEECNSTVVEAPAPVRWILSMEYQAGGRWSVREVPQSMAMLALLRNTPHALADAPEMVRVFERAVAGASCFAGRRGDVVEAAEQILRLADSL
jgi:hypothetical protein